MDILLVEDNPGDVRLTREVLKEIEIPTRLYVCGDGEEALDFLHSRGKYPAAVQPDLVLLDLNLPRRDGREVLAKIKADLSLRSIPVVILTTSSAEQDVARSYDLHANCYITKPVDLERFLGVVHLIGDFWLKTVKLPRQKIG